MSTSLKIRDCKPDEYLKTLRLSSGQLRKFELMVIDEVKKDLPEGAWILDVDVAVRIGVALPRDTISREGFWTKTYMVETPVKSETVEFVAKELDIQMTVTKSQLDNVDFEMKDESEK